MFPSTLQAAAEYGGAVAGTAARTVAPFAERVGTNVERAWHTLTADPLLAGGVAVMFVLLVLVMRTGKAR